MTDLEAREALRAALADFAEHERGEHDAFVLDCSICRVEMTSLGFTVESFTVKNGEVTK
jgi:hypothetical protein